MVGIDCIEATSGVLSYALGVSEFSTSNVDQSSVDDC
jgi:hypothetical protein